MIFPTFLKTLIISHSFGIVWFYIFFHCALGVTLNELLSEEWSYRKIQKPKKPNQECKAPPMVANS